MSEEDRARTQQEIDDLTEDLRVLTLQFTRGTTRINNRLVRLTNQLNNTEPNTFRVGDTVEITNNYRGNRGVQGIVTKVTKKQVTLREQRGNNTAFHTRSYKNVRVINDDQ